MKTSNRRNICLLFVALLAAVTTAALAPAQAAHSPRAGLIVHVWYQGYCEPPTPGVGPFCTLPRPYSGTFSIFTRAGKHVASASTDLLSSFSVALRPGRYIIVPDDPLLAEQTTTVIVRGHRFTEVMIWIPPN